MAPDSLDVDRLNELLWSFAGQRVVTVAGRTGLLRRLARSPGLPEEVADELGLDALATGKLVRALCALGVLEVMDERYRVAPALAPWLDGGDRDLTPFLDHAHSLYDRWGAHLEGWVRGQGWPSSRRGPEDLERFGAAMRALGLYTADLVVRQLDLTGCRRALGVGGGFGHFARALCDAVPGLEATVLDLPEVVEAAASAVEDPTLGGRVAFVGGDYLASDYGSGFDLVLFANVLHQELPAQAASMLRRGAEALAPGGRAVVVDFSIDADQRESVMGALFAVNMRDFGDTHTFPAISRWMLDADLEAPYRVDLSPHRWMIVGARPLPPEE